MRKKRKTYSQEFKLEALSLAESIGISKAAKDLGIHEATLRRWKNEAVTKGFPESGKKSYRDLEKENQTLKRELGYMQKINEVLKKSTAIFSQEGMGDWK